MSTFGTMVAEIREELRRSGMDNAIKRAIGAAVQFHRDKRFAWNELSFSFSTVANQDEYDSTDNSNIGRLAKIDSAKIVTPETVLTVRDIDYIRGIIRDTSGVPLDIAYYEGSLVLSPAPNAAYSVSVLGLLELNDTNQPTTPTNLQSITRSNILLIPDGYTTAWFVDGFEVIKSWAKGYVYHNHLRNSEQAANEYTAAGGFRTDQENQLANRGASGFVRPTAF